MVKKILVVLTVGLFVLGVCTAALAERSGKEVYESKCKMCHATGVAGAPKYGDKVWLDLLAKGPALGRRLGSTERTPWPCQGSPCGRPRPPR